jgi:hypothetical protein
MLCEYLSSMVRRGLPIGSMTPKAKIADRSIGLNV